MATKNDLIEAQSFSRRRLLTAFVSGAPGGNELEPARPMRAVIAAVALTAAVILAGVFYGLAQPGLPAGWENNKLVIAKDSGARYVTDDGVLHPVLNTVSARLLIPSSDFKVLTTNDATLASIKVGSPVGIVGAPDTLPAPSRLIGDRWDACVADGGGTTVRIGGSVAASPSASAAVIREGDDYWVVAGTHRYRVEGGETDAVLRAAGIDALDPVTAQATWLNLFTQGTPLAPILISNAGLPLKGTGFRIGDVLHATGTAEDVRLVVEEDGTLGRLSALAWQLYQLGNGRDAVRVQEVSQNDIANLRTGDRIGAADWPTDGFRVVATGERPCAQLRHDATGAPQTVFATVPDGSLGTAGVRVQAGHGALVRAAGSGAGSSALLTLVDPTGTAFALPGATSETVKRLGYTAADESAVPRTWIQLLPAGPALTTAAAGRNPAGSG